MQSTFRDVVVRWSLRVVAIGGLVGAAVAARPWWRGAAPEAVVVTHVVRRGALPIVVSAGGELQSANSVDVISEAEGQQTKIVEMLPEGTTVAKDDVVMRFDTTDIRKAINESKIKVMRSQTALKAAEEELKIQTNKGASLVAQAQLQKTLANLDLTKYQQGDYTVQENDLQGLIALAKMELDEANTTMEHYKKLVKQGFRTPEQLRAKEEAVQRAKYFLSRDTAKLDVLEKYTRQRQLAELSAKAKESDMEFGRAQGSAAALRTKAQNDVRAAEATLKLDQTTAANLERQLEKFTVKAPQAGVVVYAPAASEESRIRSGAVVHYKQKLFSLPDLTKMQVRSFIHESVVAKVRTGLTAEVRIEAYPSGVLSGVVKQVSTLHDSERTWITGGVKEYATLIEINKLPPASLKPGMTAEVRIHVQEVPDAMLVPVQAVTESGGTVCVFVRRGDGFERRDVEVGESNDRMVAIVKGLEVGDEVALDARQRLAESQ